MKNNSLAIKEIMQLCKPISDYLKNNYDTYTTLVITDSQIKLVKNEIGIPIKRNND